MLVLYPTGLTIRGRTAGHCAQKALQSYFEHSANNLDVQHGCEASGRPRALNRGSHQALPPGPTESNMKLQHQKVYTGSINHNFLRCCH